MLEIELSEPKTEVCHCCGGTTTRLTRFVYEDGDAFALYYAAFSDNHPERVMKVAVSIGEWGENATPDERRSFALVLRTTESQYEVMVVDADESPWQDVEIIGPMLNRDEALAHPWIEEVFHITDHMVTEDPEIIAYFEGKPANA